MKFKTETYLVDKSKYGNYVKNVNQRTLYTAAIIFGVVITLIGFIASKNEKAFPLVPFVFVSGVILLGAFFWGQKNWTKTLLKFQDAIIEITAIGISLKGTSLKSRTIPFDKIAVIDKSSKGTTIVKGNFWTKVDYYRPKRGGMPLDHEDRIFIPRVTEDYEKLIEKIKTRKHNTVYSK